MDGVLIEAKEWHYLALNKALDLFGMKISRFDHLEIFDGLPTRKKLHILSVQSNFPTQLHNFVNDLKQIYVMEMVHTQCKPRFIHEYALSKLKTDGFKIAVCSNSIRNTVDTMMDKAALSAYIDLKVSNQDVTLPKPDPEMYLKAMEYFKLHPSECLVVEDNEHGIRAAVASGAHLLVVKDTFETNYDNIKRKIQIIESEFKSEKI